MEMPALARLCI